MDSLFKPDKIRSYTPLNLSRWFLFVMKYDLNWISFRVLIINSWQIRLFTFWTLVRNRVRRRELLFHIKVIVPSFSDLTVKVLQYTYMGCPKTPGFSIFPEKWEVKIHGKSPLKDNLFPCRFAWEFFVFHVHCTVKCWCRPVIFVKTITDNEHISAFLGLMIVQTGWKISLLYVINDGGMDW